MILEITYSLYLCLSLQVSGIDMSRKPIVIGCLLSGGLIVIGCSGFLFWLNSLTTYSVEAYRSVDVIAGKTKIESSCGYFL